MGYHLSTWTLAVTLVVSTVHVWCFLPVLTRTSRPGTYSHVQITMRGVQGAAANFLKDNRLVKGSFKNPEQVLDEYFKTDNDNREKFNMRVMDISTYLNTVQRDVKRDAKYTVNGERIGHAFNLLKILSTDIRNLISIDPYGKGAQERTLKSLATALLVIQSFYSSTNWVEMEGDRYSPAFGGEGDLPQIVKKSKETCSDCDRSTEMPCENNIITDHLTSGFRPDQDIAIPSLKNGLKCSQGWNTDNDRLAIGGIGKDTSDADLSPHAEFHDEAANAAIRATTAYLYQNGKGVLSKLSVENFKRLLVLKSMEEMSNTSLTFVMDVTGSMRDDIMEARASAINKVTEFQGTPNEPADYVLATFSDPEDLTTGEILTSADEMIDRLNSIEVDDGGDTPEYSMSGLLKGMSLSKNGSMVYMFTDAPAKDSDRVDEVIALARAKGIKICPFYTSARKPSRVMDTVYTQIAKTTGCMVHQTQKTELTAMLSKMMDEHMPSSLIMMKNFRMSQNESDRTGVFIDRTTDLMTIEANGVNSLEDIAVEDPTGSILQYKAGVASRYHMDGKVMISVMKPVAGEWKVVRNTENLLAVSVTGSSSLDFTFQLTEQDEKGVDYIIQGNPIAGFDYTIAAQMLHLDHNALLKSISLVDLYGNEIEQTETRLYQIGTDMVAFADFTMPPENFRVQISGALHGGQNFQRTNPQVTSPVNVKLRLQTHLNPFPFNEPQNINYELGYHGPTNQTFTVTIDTDAGRLTTETSTLRPGEVSEYYFQIKGQPTFQILTYHVTVRENGSDKVLQSLSNTVWFQDPVCDIIYNNGSCPEEVDPPDSCQSITWSSRAVLTPEVTSYEISTNDTNIEIMVDYTTDRKQYINVRCKLPMKRNQQLITRHLACGSLVRSLLS